MQIKLAEALLRRKELNNKVDSLKTISKEGLFEVKVKRQKVSDDIDDIVAQVPKISMKQVTHAQDWHARQLRIIDAAIQQANWVTHVDVDSSVMEEYVDPYVTVTEVKK